MVDKIGTIFVYGSKMREFARIFYMYLSLKYSSIKSLRYLFDIPLCTRSLDFKLVLIAQRILFVLGIGVSELSYHVQSHFIFLFIERYALLTLRGVYTFFGDHICPTMSDIIHLLSVCTRDYEGSIKQLNDAATLTIIQFLRKIDETKKPVTDWQLATFQNDDDPYRNPWMVQCYSSNL